MAGVYIHIPFCRQDCHYCDFYFSVSLHYKDQIVEAIKKEIIIRKDYLGDEYVETIYFGGGTPSVLSAKEVWDVLNTIISNYKISDNPEITFEVNPEDVNTTYISDLKYCGINRLSLGIQSFHEPDLTLMNRRHHAGKGWEAIDIIRKSGIYNFSTDLIYAIPGSNMGNLERNLIILLKMEVPHVSVYHLSIEEGTVFSYKIKKKRLTETGEGESERQYKHIRDKLQINKYIHYEISNFSKEGYIAQHNSSYWFGKKYIGVGPSAHSYNGKTRQWNVPALKKYLQGITGQKGYYEIEKLNEIMRYNEYIMVRLRTMWGVNHQEMVSLFGNECYGRFLKETKKFVMKGLVNQNTQKTWIDPKNYLLSDHIISRLFID